MRADVTADEKLELAAFAAAERRARVALAPGRHPLCSEPLFYVRGKGWEGWRHLTAAGQLSDLCPVWTNMISSEGRATA